MGSVNKVILLGNLGKDPEVRYTTGGQAVANFSLATNESWTDKQGVKQDRSEWHKIVVWGKTAELAGEYLKKGSPVYIEGRLQTREWADKEGKKNYSTEIFGDKMVFVGGGKSDGADTGGSRSNSTGRSNGRPQSTPDDFGPNPEDVAQDRRGGGRGPNPPPVDEDSIPF